MILQMAGSGVDAATVAAAAAALQQQQQQQQQKSQRVASNSNFPGGTGGLDQQHQALLAQAIAAQLNNLASESSTSKTASSQGARSLSENIELLNSKVSWNRF